MKITANNWKPDVSSALYKSAWSEENDVKEKEEKQADTDVYEESSSLDSLLETASESSASGYKTKSSVPSDSVGQLAAELARAETRIDVQQVSSKAMRAFTNLKMSAAFCDESDKKKITQMIKRMEKLIKRIGKKLQQLGKEEQLELQKKRAEQKEEFQNAKDLEEKLSSGRRKRRREEKNYAMKELAKDGKESAKEMVAAVAGSGAVSGSYDASVPAIEGVSVDVTV